MQPWLHHAMPDAPAPPSDEWVMLSHHLPRVPSTPRIAVWRSLRRLGVAQVADGLVALPADARTREQLEWVAEEVVEHGGGASVWLARPAAQVHARALATAMATARAEEYAELAAAARAALDAPPAEQRRTVARLRRTRRAIVRRDFFPPPQRDDATAALRELEARVAEQEPAPAPVGAVRAVEEVAR